MSTNCKDKIKVLFIHHNCEIGGAERSVIDIVSRLNTVNFHPLVLLPNKGELYNHLQPLNIYTKVFTIMWFQRTINPIKLIYYILNYCIILILLKHLVKLENISIIHTNSMSGQLIGGLVAKLTKTPVIWHVRDMLKLDWMNKLLIKFCGYTATQILTISNAVQTHLRKVGIDLKKCEIVYNGIDLNKFHQNSRYEIKNTEFKQNGTIKVGIIGRLIPCKGHITFLKSAKIASDRFGHLNFYIIGDIFLNNTGYLEELHRETAKLNLKSKVRFVGFRDSIVEMIDSLDVLVVPTTIPEGFGRVIIEAMALSKPVIATNLGGPLEIVIEDSTGFLIDPNKPQDIADRIIRLARDKSLRERMGTNGRRRIEELFTIDRCVKKIENIYGQLINGYS